MSNSQFIEKKLSTFNCQDKKAIDMETEVGVGDDEYTQLYGEQPDKT